MISFALTNLLYHFMFEFAQKKNDEFWMYMKYKMVLNHKINNEVP